MQRGKDMKIKLKFWLFRNYWWVLTFAFIGLSTGIVLVQSSVDFKLLATVIGTFLSLLYFLQKQRLEETKLFREIFSDCNKRYDVMNDRLNAIVDDRDSETLSPEARATLNDYFNLCGEEYLYYTQGYIFPSVWLAWYNGMKFFINNPRINAVWAEEKKSESYYGLTF
jgi:hypothetical protein